MFPTFPPGLFAAAFVRHPVKSDESVMTFDRIKGANKAFQKGPTTSNGRIWTRRNDPNSQNTLPGSCASNFQTVPMVRRHRMRDLLLYWRLPSINSPSQPRLSARLAQFRIDAISGADFHEPPFA